MTNNIVSLKKVESNRKNAIKSTGPTTQKGKDVVKWNALKHGLLAQEIVIEKGDGKEDNAEFIKLFSQLHEDLQPVGVLEEMLVERIAISYWRLRRVIRCEIGEIRRVLDNTSYYDTIRRIEEFEFEKKYIQIDESKKSLLKNSLGVEFLIKELEEIKYLIEDAGHLTKDAKEKLFKNFGTDEGGIAFMCHLVDYMSKGKDDENEDLKMSRPSTKKSKEVMLRLIDDHNNKLEKMKCLLEENENNELDARWESLYLPSREAVDKILRYETTIERQLYRAINQLESLQSKRKLDFGFVS